MTTVTPLDMVGPQGIDVLYSLSYKWLGATGILIVIITGSIVSRLSAPVPVDPSLVIPLCDLLCCCLPEKVRSMFRCGIESQNRNYDITADRENLDEEGKRLNEEITSTQLHSEETEPTDSKNTADKSDTLLAVST
ncbi:sodium-coupled monocarboxylate transporter 2-like [Pecten maximus]|uniref:sodium-coupled monocarboxylate transporter 2-like n=1 Tax=Pecten maximus TaxID=6579 RepID=UPI001457F342|nr:sodium-coupled monocarboxylate transporter 2-like [Pecten maximus]